MQIRRLVPSDAATYQTLRLRALGESPTAFGSSYEEERNTPVDAIARFLAAGTNRYMFGAFVDAELVGMIGIDREQGRKEAHKAFIRSMYVRPDHRGTRIGRRLLSEALAYAASLPGLRQVTLTVIAGNLAARTLYESAGFKAWGVAPAALLVDGVLYDEIHLVHHLKAT
jgi:RimJ/RimL family protein N-acetyltransferase